MIFFWWCNELASQALLQLTDYLCTNLNVILLVGFFSCKQCYSLSEKWFLGSRCCCFSSFFLLELPVYCVVNNHHHWKTKEKQQQTNELLDSKKCDKRSGKQNGPLPLLPMCVYVCVAMLKFCSCLTHPFLSSFICSIRFFFVCFSHCHCMNECENSFKSRLILILSHVTTWCMYEFNNNDNIIVLID